MHWAALTARGTRSVTCCVNSATTNWPPNGLPTGEIGRRCDAEVMLRGADAMFRGGLVHECRSIHESFANASADSVGVRHGLWLAAEDVVVGRMNNARERMQRVPVRDLPVEEQPVYAFVEAAIRIDGGTEGSSTSDYRSARTLIEDALKPYQDALRSSPRLRHYYRRFLRQLAVQRGHVVVRLVSRLRGFVTRS